MLSFFGLFFHCRFRFSVRFHFRIRSRVCVRVRIRFRFRFSHTPSACLTSSNLLPATTVGVVDLTLLLIAMSQWSPNTLTSTRYVVHNR